MRELIDWQRSVRDVLHLDCDGAEGLLERAAWCMSNVLYSLSRGRSVARVKLLPLSQVVLGGASECG